MTCTKYWRLRIARADIARRCKRRALRISKTDLVGATVDGGTGPTMPLVIRYCSVWMIEVEVIIVVRVSSTIMVIEVRGIHETVCPNCWLIVVRGIGSVVIQVPAEIGAATDCAGLI